MNAAEIQASLHRIAALAKEIEDVPSFGPDVWSMQKIDEKCREIRRLCQAIGQLVGTGDSYGDTGHQNTGHQGGGYLGTGKDVRGGKK